MRGRLPNGGGRSTKKTHPVLPRRPQITALPFSLDARPVPIPEAENDATPFHPLMLDPSPLNVPTSLPPRRLRLADAARHSFEPLLVGPTSSRTFPRRAIRWTFGVLLLVGEPGPVRPPRATACNISPHGVRLDRRCTLTRHVLGAGARHVVLYPPGNFLPQVPPPSTPTFWHEPVRASARSQCATATATETRSAQ